MPRRPSIDVFAFQDYREFLRAYYDHKKKDGRFSYRAFARRAKLKSPNYLKLVIDGQRNLTVEMAERFARACGLSGESAEYFTELVAFQHAKTISERNERYKRLRTFRRYRQAHRLDLAEDAYHSHWYLPAIRELATRPDFRPDPEWIASRLIPKIKPKEAEQALAILLELGMLMRAGDGSVGQGTPLVTTGAEVRSLHLANYHRTMMRHAAESLDRIPSHERDISSVTLCLGPEGLGMVKKAIQRFRRELLEMSEIEQDPRQVVQVNFQLFPLSSSNGEDD